MFKLSLEHDLEAVALKCTEQPNDTADVNSFSQAIKTLCFDSQFPSSYSTISVKVCTNSCSITTVI